MDEQSYRLRSTVCTLWYTVVRVCYEYVSNFSFLFFLKNKNVYICKYQKSRDNTHTKIIAEKKYEPAVSKKNIESSPSLESD